MVRAGERLMQDGLEELERALVAFLIKGPSVLGQEEGCGALNVVVEGLGLFRSKVLDRRPLQAWIVPELNALLWWLLLLICCCSAIATINHTKGGLTASEHHFARGLPTKCLITGKFFAV